MLTPLYAFTLGCAVGALAVVLLLIGVLAYATRHDVPVPPRIDEVPPC